MSASNDLASILTAARATHSARVVQLNAIARGDITLTAEQRSDLINAEKRIRELLEVLGDGVTTKARVVSMEEVAAEREALPKGLREAYELLWCRAYGTDPAVSVGDANVVRGLGKRETRTSSGQVQQPVPGAPSATKKFGQATRNIVQDRRAYDFKIKMDRRLRRLAHEIEQELAGQLTVFRVNVCTHCARLGDDEWRWCPSCGHTMEEQER